MWMGRVKLYRRGVPNLVGTNLMLSDLTEVEILSSSTLSSVSCCSRPCNPTTQFLVSSHQME